MTIYALQKDASGTVTGLASWGNSTAVPEGYVACTADEYATAKQAFMSTIKDQAIGALAQIQSTAALTVAMGETFGVEMRSYVKALQAIADGTDTTSMTLPSEPAAVTS